MSSRPRAAPGAMPTLAWACICAAGLLLLLIAGCSRSEPRLVLYCGAGIRPPVAEAVQQFTQREGIAVDVDYAGSEVLLGRIKLSGRGDLLLPGDMSYIDTAEAEGLVAAHQNVCYLVPVILVQKVCACTHAILSLGLRSTGRMFSPSRPATPVEGPSSRLFAASMLAFVGLFLLGFLAVMYAGASYVSREAVAEVLHAPEVRAAAWLSLWTSLASTALGLVVAVPMGYALSRYRFPGHRLVDSIVDLPIILPPLIVGLALLVFFRTAPGRWIEEHGMTFVFDRNGIILCQLFTSASFGIRAIKLAFDGIDRRLEHVALSLGSTRLGAFFRVTLPLAQRGVIAGAILIWTRAFGTFGAIQVFVGTMRMRTEVLASTIFLEQSVGRLEVALALAMLMILMALTALMTVRILGLREP